MLRHLNKAQRAVSTAASVHSRAASSSASASIGSSSNSRLTHHPRRRDVSSDAGKSASSSSSSGASMSSTSARTAEASHHRSLSTSTSLLKNAAVAQPPPSPKASASPHIPSASASTELLRVTTLPNGVRVATDGTPGHFVAAGIYVGAGSRFEWPGNSGSSHLIDRLAFKSTQSRSAEDMTSEIEALGGQFLASTSREVIMYQASSYTHSLPSVMSLLSDTVLNPRITPEELEQQRQSCAWELQEINNKPEMILPERLYEVAFKGNTLGHPLLVQEDRLSSIDAETIKDFRRTWFRPDRMVVAGAGIPHEQLLELTQQAFSKFESSLDSSASQTTAGAARSSSTSSSSSARNVPTHLFQSTSSSATKPRGAAPYATAADSFLSASNAPTYEQLANATPHYTGGQLYDTSRPDLEFSHLYVGYEGLSIHDPDVYALATLQMLLGGGSSFSAGGPGKGMYSRLYTSLLNRYHDVEHCSAFHHCYLDTGLFAMCISVNHGFVNRAPLLIAEQLDSLMDTGARKGLNVGEVNRAKNQLKSSLVMALESRMVQVEDLGRQVLAHGHKVPIETMLEKIDEVTLPDLQRVARRIFRPTRSSDALLPGEQRSGEPTILAIGQIDRLGDVRDVLRRYGLTP